MFALATAPEPSPPIVPEPPGSPATPPSSTTPVLVPPFKSPLKLTPDQFTKLESESLQRMIELRREMGLTLTNEVIPGSWMWLRQCHEAYYQGDLSWRIAAGNIFEKSNFTLGSGMRHVRYMAARVQDDLLGPSPFMAAMGRNQDAEELARQVEEYVQNEIDRAPVKSELRGAQKVALYRNECVVKTGWISDATPFIGEATILVDAASGQPVTTKEKGIFIYEDDRFMEDPSVAGLMRLETDPSFAYTQNPEPGLVTIPADGDTPERTGRYQYFEEVPQTLVRREGVYCEALDYRSLLAPLKVKDLDDADTVVHLYLETPGRVRKLYGGIDAAARYFSWWDAPGQDKPKFEQGESGLPPTAIFQQLVVGECYRLCDPDETGEDKECFLVFDMTNKKLIYYNYLANHMARRPFRSIPGVEKVPGRWYGRGIYGMLTDHLLYEDAELNRANFKNSKDATIQFAYQDACAAWKRGQPPVIGSEKTVWISSTWNPEGGKRPIWRENLYEKIESDLEMMKVMKNSADALIGAISTSSAAEADFNPSKTATGDQLIQQSSDVITKATEQEQVEAIEGILEQIVDVCLEHMDRTKLMFSKHADQLVMLNRNQCRTLDRDVRLLLTRSKSTQLLTTSKEALIIAKDYRLLMQQDPEGARLLRDLYIAQLKGLEVEDADQVCPEITDEMIAAFRQSQQQGQAQEPPKRSIATKYGDLARSEQEQVLAQEGIKPAAPEELAHAAMEAAALHAPTTPQATPQGVAQQPPTELKAA